MSVVWPSNSRYLLRYSLCAASFYMLILLFFRMKAWSCNFQKNSLWRLSFKWDVVKINTNPQNGGCRLFFCSGRDIITIVGLFFPETLIKKQSKSLSKKSVFIGFEAVLLEISTWHLVMLPMYPNRMDLAVILSYQPLIFMHCGERKIFICLRLCTPPCNRKVRNLDL